MTHRKTQDLILAAPAFQSNVLVFRGLDFSLVETLNLKVGDLWTHVGFLWATFWRSEACWFTNDTSMCYDKEGKRGPDIQECLSTTENPKGTLLRITILKGTPFLDLTNPIFSGAGGSAQILLPSHLPFVITKIHGHQVSLQGVSLEPIGGF